MTIVSTVLAAFYALAALYGAVLFFKPENDGYTLISVGLWASLAAALRYGATNELVNILGALVSLLALLASAAVTNSLPMPAVGKTSSLIAFVTVVVFVIRVFS